MDLLENCNICYSVELSQFSDSITIKARLTASTGYYIKVTDKFGNAYTTEEIETDGSGYLVMPVPISFPTGWFNRNAGGFNFQISKTTQPWAPETLTFGSSTYTCVAVEFVLDTTPLNIIE
jgi:hypothetical protein